MSFFNPISGEDFNQKLARARETNGAMIVDVRADAELAQGRVPGAVSIPLNRIAALDVDRGTPLFLYCRSGARSQRACGALRKLGYTDVTNLGGILDYRGPVEKP